MENNNIDIYDSLVQQIEDHDDKNYSKSKTAIKKALVWLKSNYSDIIMFLSYTLLVIRIIYMILALGKSIYNLNTGFLPSIGSGVIISIILPSIIWLYSTCLDRWNFQNRKIFGLVVLIINAVLVLDTMILLAASELLLPKILLIPVSRDITVSMVINLARGVFIIILGVADYLILFNIFKNMFDKNTIKAIMHFKLNRDWDNRKNKKHCYDFCVVRYLTNGKIHRVFEADRFLHTNVVGATGTAKTSSVLTVSINNDLDKRIKNEDIQKRKLSKLLKKGKIRMIRDFDDADFSINYFESDDKKYQRKIDKIRDKYKISGITAMAPNEKFSDELYRIAKSKGIKVNRIDPILHNWAHKEGFIGFNPLYINPNIKGVDRKIEIFNKARLFADVLQAIFEKDEIGDIYFAGLNRNLTTSVTVMVLLTYPSLHKGKQPTPDVVQEIINDFDKAEEYRNELVRLYSTKFRKGDKNDPVMEPGKANIGEYQFILDVIDKDVLGNGRKQMEDQARGLRNIINETLSNPLIRQVLCAENTIDMDNILNNGEVTFINFAINLGTAGTAFGMFYLLSFINAVFRRPAEKKLLPHFVYIDELPEILHPELGRAFALFRQYCVGLIVAMQSLDQLEKSPKTKYLKNVVLGGCSHHIVFGRCSPAEMKIYQEFGGMKDEVIEMTGTTETALSLDVPTKSMMRRETVQKVNVIDGGDMRYRDFREVTMFTVSKGNPVTPFYGKTFFLDDIKKIEQKRFVFNWSQYFMPKEGFKDEVDSLKDSIQLKSSTALIEGERKIKALSTKNIAIETSKEAVTELNIDTININKSESNVNGQIFIKSGKDLNYNVNEDDISAENIEDDSVFSIEIEEG